MSGDRGSQDLDDDDDMPELSAHALAALQEFYTEQQQVQEDASALPVEDWQLSQFWYDEETCDKLAKEVLATVGHNGRVACISCPSLFKALQPLKEETLETVLFEFDTRFSVYLPNFVHYDYNKPLAVPAEMKQQFDLVVADPPFLNEECLSKIAQTMKHLGKEKLLLCTGIVMADTAKQLLGLEMLQFLPRHKNNLANEFRCYANYPTTIL